MLFDKESGREVQRSTEAVDDNGGHFIRLRVVVDITLPLCLGSVITLENGIKSWVKFNNERLLNLCYWCGRLDRSNKNYDLRIRSKGTLSPDQQQYTSSLKAAPYMPNGNDVIFVPSNFENRSAY